MARSARRVLFSASTAAVLLLVLREGCLRSRDAARLASCNPRWIFNECQNYAKSHNGVFPPLSSEFGRLLFDAADVELLGPVHDRVCESDPNVPEAIFSEAATNTPVNDWSYVYLGYFLETESQGMAFVRAYHTYAGKDGAFDQDLSVGAGAGNCGGHRLFRLRESSVLPAEVACLKESAASIPVIIEWPENHRKGGQVVYLDGHTEYVHYPGKFPMIRDFIQALRTIDAQIHLSPPP